MSSPIRTGGHYRRNRKATNAETNLSRETTTTDQGIYSFQQLSPGRYKVEITASGLRRYEAEAVVNITQTTDVDAQVGISGASDTVTVQAEAPVLQTETSQNGRVVTGETIRQLPLPTRNFQQLLTLSPGARRLRFPTTPNSDAATRQFPSTVSARLQTRFALTELMPTRSARIRLRILLFRRPTALQEFISSDIALRRFERSQRGRKCRSDYAQRNQ